MTQHQLSFAKINLLSDSIVELVIHEGVEVSLEMLEELDDFFTKFFTVDFGLLINRINSYFYTFEAKMMAISHGTLCATAIVVYNEEARQEVADIMRMRAMDELNLKVFSGVDFGWQEGYDWLKAELKTRSGS